MSAITGIFYRDGRTVSEKQIQKMNDRLSHRGPDGSLVWCEGSVGLGHQMLHTTPESLHETLPYEEDGLVITADARIDNRKELSDKLGIEDKEEISDSYFILKAYQKWGEKCPEELLGDFAFAIWDKDKEQLFCARDHMGVKPFYYYYNENTIYFSTEIKAILIISESQYAINELKIAYFLMYEKFDKKYTFYKDILRLPGSCSITITPDKIKFRKYWILNPQLRINLDSEEEYIKEFQKIFSEAINCRLRSVYPVGYELSGGLDSSSIVCMAKKILNEKTSHQPELKTFAYIFKEIPEFDEKSHIKHITDTGGIKHQFVYADDVSLIYSDNIYRYLEQPPENPYYTIKWKMYSEIHKKNIRILFSGAGGDGTISHGKYHLKDLAWDLKISRLIKELSCQAKLNKQRFHTPLIYDVIFPSIPEKIKKFINSKIMRKNRNCIFNKEFIRSYIDQENLDKINLQGLSINNARNYHYLVLNDFDMQSSLEFANKIGSAFNIEPRYPYFDKRLIEFCYGIPDEFKFRNGGGRYLQRVSLINILPEETRWRYSKTKFSPIIKRNLLLFGKKRIENTILDEKKKMEKYVDLNAVEGVFMNYQLGHHYSVLDLQDIWRMISLNYFLNTDETVLTVKN